MNIKLKVLFVLGFILMNSVVFAHGGGGKCTSSNSTSSSGQKGIVIGGGLPLGPSNNNSQPLVGGPVGYTDTTNKIPLPSSKPISGPDDINTVTITVRYYDE